jgi:glycosyltransferase 2 family protein
MNKRRFFMLVGLGAFALIVIANYGRVGEFGTYLGQARWYILIFIVVMQLFGYYCTAKFYQKFTSLFASPPELPRLYKMTLAINFVNQAFPSGGVSALPYLNSQLDGVPSGKITLTHFVRYLFTYISFIAILLVGFLILMLTGNVSSITSRLTLLVVLGIIALSIAAFMIMSNETWMKRFVSWASTSINAFWTGVLRKPKEIVSKEQQRYFVAEFREGYAELQASHGNWIQPLLYLLGTNIAEILTIYIVFLSFGYYVNPGIVIAGYTLANIVSVLGVFTGGIGVFEATMIASFAALKVPVAMATAVVIVYRVLNLVIFLPIGYFFYNKSLKK